MIRFFSKPVNQNPFQHPVVENATEADVIHIVRKVELADIEGITTTEIEPVVCKLGGEKEAPHG